MAEGPSSTRVSYPPRTRLVVAGVLAVAIGAIALGVSRTATEEDPGFTVSGAPAEQFEGDVDVSGVEAFVPAEGAEILGQQPFGIDLAPGWDGELTLRPPGAEPIPLPDDELDRIDELNQLLYRPREGATVERLEGDRFCLEATIWDLGVGRDASERTENWCFSVV